MARYVEVIDLPVSAEKAFEYLADFSRTAEWDPGVASAARLSGEPIGAGSRFRVDVRFLGRTVSMEYEIVTYEPSSRLVLMGKTDSLVSVDEITFVPREQGTRVTYEARLELLGLAKLADPMLQVAFQHIGDNAVRGLRKTFDAG